MIHFVITPSFKLNIKDIGAHRRNISRGNKSKPLEYVLAYVSAFAVSSEIIHIFIHHCIIKTHSTEKVGVRKNKNQWHPLLNSLLKFQELDIYIHSGSFSTNSIHFFDDKSSQTTNIVNRQLQIRMCSSLCN